MFNLHDYAVYCQFKIIDYSKCVKLDMNQCEIWQTNLKKLKKGGSKIEYEMDQLKKMFVM